MSERRSASVGTWILLFVSLFNLAAFVCLALYQLRFQGDLEGITVSSFLIKNKMSERRSASVGTLILLFVSLINLAAFVCLALYQLRFQVDLEGITVRKYCLNLVILCSKTYISSLCLFGSVSVEISGLFRRNNSKEILF